MVEIVNVALVAPAATVTFVGTAAAAVSLLARTTTAPPGGEAALRVTVPLEGLPPVTAAGLRLTADRVTTGVTVSAAAFVTPPYVAVIVTEAVAGTELVDTTKVAAEAPAGTITIAGTVAATALLLETATGAPPAGAAVFRVTVAVAASPPGTLLGSRLSEVGIVAGPIRNHADLMASSKDAEMLNAVQPLPDQLVDTTKLALLSPSWTVTLAGTIAAAGFSLASVTVTPPAGAGLTRLTVPVDALPEMTMLGSRLREASGECWNRPVGLQNPPPFVLLKTPPTVAR